jgi:glycosyltransferase involved in cell wall biosynthesis
LPKVSIIIPAFNSKKTINRALTSCLDQTYSDIEVIVIDDGSTDGTGEVVKSINDTRIKYFFFENSGRSIARNRGLQHASGIFIQFLDSDDTIDKEKVKMAMAVLEDNPGIDAVQCGTKYWKNNEVVFESKADLINNTDKVLLRKNIFPIHSIIFKKEIASTFPEKISHCEDWYFWMNTLYKAKVSFQPKYFGANVFIHENNTMTNYYDMLLGEIYIMLCIKKNINLNSYLRDIKLLKQYMVFLARYDSKAIKQLDLTPEEIMPEVKIINFVFNQLGAKKVIKQYLEIKNRFFKREQLY